MQTTIDNIIETTQNSISVDGQELNNPSELTNSQKNIDKDFDPQPGFDFLPRDNYKSRSNLLLKYEKMPRFPYWVCRERYPFKQSELLKQIQGFTDYSFKLDGIKTTIEETKNEELKIRFSNLFETGRKIEIALLQFILRESDCENKIPFNIKKTDVLNRLSKVSDKIQTIYAVGSPTIQNIDVLHTETMEILTECLHELISINPGSDSSKLNHILKLGKKN